MSFYHTAPIYYLPWVDHEPPKYYPPEPMPFTDEWFLSMSSTTTPTTSTGVLSPVGLPQLDLASDAALVNPDTHVVVHDVPPIHVLPTDSGTASDENDQPTDAELGKRRKTRKTPPDENDQPTDAKPGKRRKTRKTPPDENDQSADAKPGKRRKTRKTAPDENDQSTDDPAVQDICSIPGCGKTTGKLHDHPDHENGKVCGNCISLFRLYGEWPDEDRYKRKGRIGLEGKPADGLCPHCHAEPPPRGDTGLPYWATRKDTGEVQCFTCVIYWQKFGKSRPSRLFGTKPKRLDIPADGLCSHCRKPPPLKKNGKPHFCGKQGTDQVVCRRCSEYWKTHKRDRPSTLW